MRESYTQYKGRVQGELEAFPIAFAFNEKQFAEGMASLGLSADETDKVLSIPGGGFIRKTDEEKFTNMVVRHAMELVEAFKADETGDGFIFEAFNYELANHEYCITYDPTDALAALGLTMGDVNKSPAMIHGLKLAIKENQKWS